ncbi:MAG: Rod shape-determining protein MreC [Acidobacteria bacterium]|nr:Rod shape-determining protein MreC [Acidobacteriota bacterium]
MFSRHRNLVILTAVLFAQLGLLAYQFRRGTDIPLIRNGTMYVVTPVQRALRAVTDTLRGAVYGYVDLRDARQQSQDLAREVEQLQLEAQRLRREASQARRLQVLLDFREELPLPVVAAQVIGAGAGENSHTVILDKGRDAGLRPDLPVIVPGGIVGKVLRVFADTAQVVLITDANSGVACLLENSRIHGVLKGTNKPLGRLLYVNTGEKVEVGEAVVTSGEDRIYPKGLPVGVVVSARPGPEFQEIEVQPIAQLNRLEEVLVVLEREASEAVPLAAPAGAEARPAPVEPAQRRASTAASPSAPERATLPPPAATPPAAPPPGETPAPRSSASP